MYNINDINFVEREAYLLITMAGWDRARFALAWGDTAEKNLRMMRGWVQGVPTEAQQKAIDSVVRLCVIYRLREMVNNTGEMSDDRMEEVGAQMVAAVMRITAPVRARSMPARSRTLT